MPLIECVPNFSEGRDIGVVSRIRDAIAAARGATVLDWSADAWHHRSVITFVAPASQIVDAALAAVVAARDSIDMRAHAGVHPRIGAADVIPFVPLGEATMAECVDLARTLGARVGQELEIPVYLYGEAATIPERSHLANVRRGQLEGLRETIAVDPSRTPDFGPARVHPTFGAIAIGARPVLVAFNCFLGDAGNLSAVREIARAVRESSGGLPGIRALALDVDGQAQLSMNLVDLARTPVHVALDAVRREAVARGLMITRSELIGLMPEGAIDAAALHALRLPRTAGGRILERLVREIDSGAADTPAAGIQSSAVGELMDACEAMLDLLVDPRTIAPVSGGLGDSGPEDGASRASAARGLSATGANMQVLAADIGHAVPARLASVASSAVRLAESLGQRDAATRLRAKLRAAEG